MEADKDIKGKVLKAKDKGLQKAKRTHKKMPVENYFRRTNPERYESFVVLSG